jgi:hypothetical protein
VNRSAPLHRQALTEDVDVEWRGKIEVAQPVLALFK